VYQLCAQNASEPYAVYAAYGLDRFCFIRCHPSAECSVIHWKEELTTGAGTGGGDYHTAAQRPLLSAVQSLSRSVLGLVECSHILKNGKESALKLAIERWL
jgi:hypothetical protein